MLFRPQSTIGWQLFFARWILMSPLLDMMNHVLRSVHKLHNHFGVPCETKAKLFCCVFLTLNSLWNTKYTIITITTVTSMAILLLTTIKGDFKRWRKRLSRWSPHMPLGQAASRCQHNLRCNTSNACSYMHNIIPIPQIPAMFLRLCTTKRKRFKVVMYLLALAITMAWYL